MVEPTPAMPPPPESEVDTLRREVGDLLGQLRRLEQGEEPPPWALRVHAQLEQRMERIMEMQERLAARVETPVPRLDEPIVLFTVAGCMLFLGFVIGRGVQRRSNRRDGRLRL